MRAEKPSINFRCFEAKKYFIKKIYIFKLKRQNIEPSKLRKCALKYYGQVIFVKNKFIEFKNKLNKF